MKGNTSPPDHLSSPSSAISAIIVCLMGHTTVQTSVAGETTTHLDQKLSSGVMSLTFITGVLWSRFLATLIVEQLVEVPACSKTEQRVFRSVNETRDYGPCHMHPAPQ